MDLDFLVRKSPLILSSLWLGAATAVALIQPKSRQRLDQRNKLLQWSDSFRSALTPMAGLALTAATAGSYNYYLTNNLSYLYGAATWAVLFPYTFAVVRPLFTRLLKADEERKEEGTEGVIREWVTAHRGRVLLGVLATLFYLYAEASSGREVVKVVVNTV